MTHQFDRRRFHRILGLTALTATVPTFLHKTGQILAGDERREVPPLSGLKDNRVLVIVQLAGGVSASGAGRLQAALPETRVSR